jgi:hypothetical protein
MTLHDAPSKDPPTLYLIPYYFHSELLGTKVEQWLLGLAITFCVVTAGLTGC